MTSARTWLNGVAPGKIDNKPSMEQTLSNRIFEAFAPTYWAGGLPVIPLRPRNKMPDINGWSTYGTRMPNQIEQTHWLHSFPKGNIGLPLGSASGLCIIDIDTEDE